MTALEQQGLQAKQSARELSVVDTSLKNKALEAIARALNARRAEWLSANASDVEQARQDGMSESLLDRLTLTDARIDGIVSAVREVIELPDPVGECVEEVTRPNGLLIQKQRVPLGVIAIIYEARPNVTVDAAVLCLKSGNACILRGGKEAFSSNRAVVSIMQDALEEAGLSRFCIQLVQDTSRESAAELMHLNQYVDVLIPRGGAGLIRFVTQNASVPVIRTGEGVCHVYIDKDADLKIGASVLENAKCSRPSVCNACECVLIHEDVVKDFLTEAIPLLEAHHVELRCDEASFPIAKELVSTSVVKSAEEADWDTEYGDYILAIRVVKDVREAVDFITAHGTEHSEAIITENKETAAFFLRAVDAAAVYVNASTRFTDGGEFGLGAEIGISTQKMHARGPMGLRELTSWKYVVYGEGQIR